MLDAVVEIHDNDGIGQHIQDSFSISTVPSGLFGDSQVGDITADGPRGPATDRESVRHEMPLYVPYLPVLAGDRTLEIAGTGPLVHHMFPAGWVWPEHLVSARIAHHFRASIACDLLALAIPEGDMPLDIQGEHRRRQLIEKLVVPRVANIRLRLPRLSARANGAGSISMNTPL
jgi:hypothetical protein